MDTLYIIIIWNGKNAIHKQKLTKLISVEILHIANVIVITKRL